MREKYTPDLECGFAIAMTGNPAEPGPATPHAPVVLVVEAASEEAAREHFVAIQEGREKEALIELTRGLMFLQAQETGRYWRFEFEAGQNKAKTD